MPPSRFPLVGLAPGSCRNSSRATALRSAAFVSPNRSARALSAFRRSPPQKSRTCRSVSMTSRAVTPSHHAGRWSARRGSVPLWREKPLDTAEHFDVGPIRAGTRVGMPIFSKAAFVVAAGAQHVVKIEARAQLFDQTVIGIEARRKFSLPSRGSVSGVRFARCRSCSASRSARMMPAHSRIHAALIGQSSTTTVSKWCAKWPGAAEGK